MKIQNEYPEHIIQGIKKLLIQSPNFNVNDPDIFTGKKADSNEKTFNINQHHSIPVATKEYTKFIEESLRAKCQPFENLIDEMSYEELEAFNWVLLMAYDAERGLGLGQIPHIKFNYSLEFILWERKILRRLDMGYKKFEIMKVDNENLILPFERSYWVIPGKLLAGEIPSSRVESIRKQKINNLVKMGFDAIVNLMEPDERTFSGELLEDYTPLLEQYASKFNREVSVFRFPIKDLSVTTPKRMFEIIQLISALIKEGKKVYLHCWGGIGRTGTVIGCYLIENQMASTENVMQTIDYLKRTTPIKDRRSPETDEQMDFILDWPVLRVSN